MTNSISIQRSFGKKVDIPLKGTFIEKSTGKKIVLLMNYAVAVDRELLSHERPFEFMFTEQNREFNYVWDTANKKQCDFAYWLKRHPFVDHPENGNKDVVTYFRLVDKTRFDQIKFSKDNAKVSVFNMIKRMTAKELMDVAFFNHINPGEMTALQIFNKLCSLEDGMLMENPFKFISDWSVSSAGKKVTIRKAVILGIIKSNGANYMIDGNIIGDMANLEAYMNKNEKYYEFLSSEVSKKDNLPKDIKSDISLEDLFSEEKATEVSKADPNEETSTDRANAKAAINSSRIDANDRAKTQQMRLRELNVPGWQASTAWSEEKRLAKIAEAEAGKEVVKEPA